MCGITGFFHADGSRSTSRVELERSVETLRLRGPDDHGIWNDGGRLGFGHTRLSILDLSPLGHQPMVSHDGQMVMVFNGEVYNFADIRRELEPLGHRFHGTGDSEVILAAFREWGVRDAVRRFIGMFAIALWDKRRERLTLIRDRLGVKPLYYGWDGRSLCFGSELKALREYVHWQPSLDPEALGDYFRYGYVVEPRSVYRGVHKLQPGHFLQIGAGGIPELHRYWSVLDAARNVAARSEAALTDELDALMVDAFKLRLIADVPVGVFLSGGIDSSTVTAVLQRHAGQRIKTFTIGFDDESINEAPHAERVAKYLGTEHTTRILRVAEAMQILPGWGDLYDEPFGDDSGVPTLLVSRLAAEHVKVVLSADGGDELFSGYKSHAAMLAQSQKLARLPSGVLGVARRALSAIPWDALDDRLADQRWPASLNHRLRYRTTVPIGKIRDRMRANGIGEMFDGALSSAWWSERELRQLLGRDTPATRSNCDVFEGEIGERLCLWDLHNYLPGDVLAKVDRATMALSIEGREPMLDHRLVEFAFSLPFRLRRGDLGPKHLLRKVLYRYVPRHLVDRPKQGFGTPMGSWLRSGLRPLIDDYLGSTRIERQALFDPVVVKRTVARLDAGDRLAVRKVWSLLAFQMWHARWMEGDQLRWSQAA